MLRMIRDALSVPDGHNVHMHVKKLVEQLATSQILLSQCEAFISGFEDDEEQDGVVELLQRIREAIREKP